MAFATFPEAGVITIPLETLAFIVVKARGFDVKVAPLDQDDGSNPADDCEQVVLGVGALAALNVDQMDELLAIVWIGRGDYQKEEWCDALAVARDSRDEHKPRYLARMPLLADYIEDGLDALGYSLEDIEGEHL